MKLKALTELLSGDSSSCRHGFYLTFSSFSKLGGFDFKPIVSQVVVADVLGHSYYSHQEEGFYFCEKNRSFCSETELLD